MTGAFRTMEAGMDNPDSPRQKPSILTLTSYVAFGFWIGRAGGVLLGDGLSGLASSIFGGIHEYHLLGMFLGGIAGTWWGVKRAASNPW
jgi:hypothetical protein